MADPLPLAGWPQGRIRIRQRADKAVVAYVRTADTTEAWLVKVVDGKWMPWIMNGVNRRVSNTDC